MNMNCTSKGFDAPIANLSQNRKIDSAAVGHRREVPLQFPLDESCADPSTILSQTSVATANVSSNISAPSLLSSVADEDRRIEGKIELLSFGENILSHGQLTSDNGKNGGSTSEIQNIMEQFDNDKLEPEVEDNRSPSLTYQFPALGSPINHPPRNSSLEQSGASSDHTSISLPGPNLATDRSQIREERKVGVFTRLDSLQNRNFARASRPGDADDVSSPPLSPVSAPTALSPEPDSEPDLTFDFHRFLEQLRHRTADPVAKFLRSFLIEFGKKQWMAHEQGKIISDFLAFIANKMVLCEVWRGLSFAEFDNAKEGMEKLVMNRLYSQTFSPAIPLSMSVPTHKMKQKILDRSSIHGRAGQHQEDFERDEILGQKVRIYGWIREEHLDILPVGDGGQRFLALAQQGMYVSKPFWWAIPNVFVTELLKINSYRAPRDKIICVLNCCKVIFGECSSHINH